MYKRSRAGDELVDPSVLSTDSIFGVVVQNPEKGHQLEGQEVLINSDLSWTNIDEPMGKVHPWNEWAYKSKGHVESQGEQSEAFSHIVDSLEKEQSFKNYGDVLAYRGASVVQTSTGRYAYDRDTHNFEYTILPANYDESDIGGLLADNNEVVYGPTEAAPFPHVIYEGKAIYANRSIQEQGKYDSVNVRASKSIKEGIIDIKNENSFSYQVAKRGTDVSTVLRYIDSISEENTGKYVKNSMISTTKGVAGGEVGGRIGMRIAKKNTPKYVGPYMRGALKTIGRETGAHAANTGLLLYSVSENVDEFKDHPDLLRQANDYDVEAFTVGEVISIGEVALTVSTGGEYVLHTKLGGGLFNFIEGLRIEKHKDELRKEKENREQELNK